MSMDTVTPAYRQCDPSGTVLYQVISDYLEIFLASIEADTNAKGLPAYVQQEFYASVKQRIAYDERAG
jgi:hypothetical protein